MAALVVLFSTIDLKRRLASRIGAKPSEVTGRTPKYNSTFDPQGEMGIFASLFVDEEMKFIKHNFYNKRLCFLRAVCQEVVVGSVAITQADFQRSCNR